MISTMKFRFKAPLLALALLLTSGMAAARADSAAQCQVQGGSYLTGVIAHGPFFIASRHAQHGVALSHTKILLRADDGQIYDIRADNVFASGYDQAPHSVPMPLATLHPGARLSLCGKLYQTHSGRMGMDWVHTNCGKPPRHNAPNGWLAEISPTMVTGPNLESSEEYCHLW